MITKITHFTLFVSNQEEALKFYTEMLGFKVHTDATFENMRWLTINPEGQPDFELVLFLAEQSPIAELVGKQAPEHVLFSVETENCQAEYEALQAKGVQFMHPPKTEPWGTAALFRDLYGNLIYMVQSA